MTGFGRRIYSDGQYHIGWWKNNFPFGYGIGNRFTGDQGVKEGLYETKDENEKFDNHFMPNGEISYDIHSAIA